MKSANLKIGRQVDSLHRPEVFFPPMPGPQPTLNAIIVCDEMITDRDTGKRSLVGIFTNIWCQNFPCQHPRLSVYTRLIDAQGTYTIRLELVRVETMQTIGEGTGQVDIPDRLQYHEVGSILAAWFSPPQEPMSFAYMRTGRSWGIRLSRLVK